MTKHFHHYSDSSRIESAIDDLASMTEPGRPFTRLVFSSEYKQARTWLWSRFEAASLKCHIDDGGNLIGTRKAVNDAAASQTIIIGSHIDTVSAGGRFDGVAGVIAGLETIHFLNKHAIDLPVDIEIVDFLGEELNVWGSFFLARTRGGPGHGPNHCPKIFKTALSSGCG